MHSFKKTLSATLLLLLCIVLVYAAFTAPYFYGTAYYYQDARVRNELSGQLDLLICGSSHAFRAIIPEQLDPELGTSGYNLANSMQTMQGRYSLLKKEIRRNPVNTVIMEVSFNALTRDRQAEGPEGDLYELGRFLSPLDRMSYFFTSFAPSEYGEVFHDTVDRSNTAWKMMLRGEMGLQSVRGYLGLNSVSQVKPEEKLKEIHHTVPLALEPDEYNVSYFEKCIELCRKENIRVILVATPMSEITLSRCDGLEEIRRIYADYASRYGCAFYDFNLLKTYGERYSQDTAFYDIYHLSEEGAALFTEDLCRVLKLDAGGGDTAGLFYPGYDEMEQVLFAGF